MQLFDDLALFLANTPGNLIYILAIAFTLIGSLQGAISNLRSGNSQMRRLVFGLSLLLAFQFTLFLISGLMEQGVILGRLLLPVFDRALLLLSVIWLIWLWVFPESSRSGDAATVLLSLLVVAATALGAVAYSGENQPIGMFNASSQVFYWNLGALLLILPGLVLLFVRKPANWGTGLVVSVLLFAGFVVDMFYPAASGDFSGITRFFVLSAFPLLFTLSTRQQSANIVGMLAGPQVNADEIEADTLETSVDEHNNSAVRERRRYSADPKTLQSLLALAAESDATRTNQFIVRSVAQVLLVDLSFLIYLGDDQSSLYVATGYDLIREENLEGGIISRETVPVLANAILKGRPLHLPASATVSDIKGFADLLGLPKPGEMLNVPLLSESGPIGSLLLLSPYSNREWNADDQAFLMGVASALVPIIQRNQRTNVGDQDRERAQTTARDALEQAMRLKTVNDDIYRQLNGLQGELQQALEENENQKKALENARQELASRQIGNGSEAATANLQSELNQALAELARVQNQFSESSNKMKQLESRANGTITSDQAEVITSISQELRQPMSSIVGYTELLLGESVGILGALQRKFIERIRTSTERIGSLVDDLIQITSFETGYMSVDPEAVDLNLIIDNAMAYTSSQIREKNIAMRIDIPEDLKTLYADRESLQQILIHLLQNAGSASAVEGSVTLRVRTQRENEHEHVIIQVSDTGGGIPKEDLSRVFSRLYRAENTLIQGVGDTGVGLSIAKTLTDAQNGRIWVDTEMGVGSTFSVSLPLRSVVSAEIPEGA